MPYRPRPRKPATGGLFSTAAAARPSEYLIACIDGGARGNPGPAAYGVVIDDQAGNRVAELTDYLGAQTNNYAEYCGLLAALDYAATHAPHALHVLSDSELMVRQMQGVYKVKAPGLQDLFARARALERQLKWFRIEHVRREKNRDADRLVNTTLDRAARAGR
jgi:ribonuclease HI